MKKDGAPTAPSPDLEAPYIHERNSFCVHSSSL